MTEKTQELAIDFQQAKKDKEILAKQLDAKVARFESQESDMKQELRSLKAQIEHNNLSYHERLEHEMANVRKKAFEAEKKQRDLEQVSGSLASHL